MGMFDWLTRSGAKAPKPQLVSVIDAQARAHAGSLTIVDVRMPEEWAATGLPEGAKGVALGAPEFADALAELSDAHPSKTLAMFCKSGMRSEKAAKIAKAHGLDRVEIVAGGMEAWTKAQLPTTPFESA
ncbi:MAG: rhodanese-like domain-containing protein [Pseudomonadota bacterium]|jgi:rhodanese-related sulfurtransferase